MDLGYKITRIRRLNHAVLWWSIEGIGFLGLGVYFLYGVFLIQRDTITLSTFPLFLCIGACVCMAVICCIVACKERGELNADVYENGIVLKHKKSKEILYYYDVTDWLILRNVYGKACGIVLKDVAHRWLTFDQYNGGHWFNKLNKSFNQFTVRYYASKLLDKENIQFSFFPELNGLTKRVTQKNLVKLFQAPNLSIVVNSNGIMYEKNKISFNEFKIAKKRKNQLIIDLFDWNDSIILSIPISDLSKAKVFLELINQIAW